MFRKSSVLFLVFILISIFSFCIVNAHTTNNVQDYLDYLSEDEVVQLQAQIDTIKNTYGLDSVIVITDDTEGKNSIDFSDDFYDYNKYGEGNNDSGLLLLINMQAREVWISTHDDVIDIFTDARISNMVNNITPYLSNGNYYSACNTFLNDLKTYANAGIPEGQYRVNTDYDEEYPQVNNDYNEYPSDGEYRVQNTYSRNIPYLSKVSLLVKSYPPYIFALIVAIIATLIAANSNKNGIMVNSLTYEEKDSFNLSNSRDDFIRESTSKTKIHDDSSSNSGGRSSTHTSSSGRTHGGGGGKF